MFSGDVFKSMEMFVQCLLKKNSLLKSFSVFSNGLNGSGKSRMNQVKFVEDSFLNNWSNMVCLSRPYHFKFVKSYLPQILLIHSWIPWFKCLLTLHTKIMHMMVLSLTHCCLASGYLKSLNSIPHNRDEPN